MCVRDRIAVFPENIRVWLCLTACLSVAGREKPALRHGLVSDTRGEGTDPSAGPLLGGRAARNTEQTGSRPSPGLVLLHVPRYWNPRHHPMRSSHHLQFTGKEAAHKRRCGNTDQVKGKGHLAISPTEKPHQTWTSKARHHPFSVVPPFSHPDWLLRMSSGPQGWLRKRP